MSRKSRSWVLGEVVQRLDRDDRPRSTYWALGCAGLLLTLLVWWAHWTHPSILGGILFRGRVERLSLVMLLAPPFLAMFGLAHAALYGQLCGAAAQSTDRRRSEADKKGKVLLASCIVSAANLLLMIACSSAEEF